MRARLQRPPHSETQAKPSIDRSSRAKATGHVEAFRMGIANHVQEAGWLQPSNAGDMIDESSSDSAFPEVRLYE
jgi:hypothetical protein